MDHEHAPEVVAGNMGRKDLQVMLLQRVDDCGDEPGLRHGANVDVGVGSGHAHDDIG